MATETRLSTGELIAEAMRPIAQRYHEHVNAIAAEAIIEYPDDDDERELYIWESVDGSEWVIYYQNARAVAMVTDNLDAAEEAGALDTPFAIASEALAFYAMRQDVEDAIARRLA